MEALAHAYCSFRRPRTQITLLNRVIKIRGLADPTVISLLEECMMASRRMGQIQKKRELAREQLTSPTSSPRYFAKFAEESTSDAWKHLQELEEDGWTSTYSCNNSSSWEYAEEQEDNFLCFGFKSSHTEDVLEEELEVRNLPAVEWPIWCTIEVLCLDFL
jgi:hypothetical protein